MAHILVIDDDSMICETLALRIVNLGHTVDAVNTLQEGLALIDRQPFDLIFLDVRLPDGNGLEALMKIKETPSTPQVIIITGVGEPDGAELAVKGGAWDYLQKPFSRQEITLQLNRALEYREKNRQHVPRILKREAIIGHSRRLNAHLDLVAQASSTDVTVLLTGESGTGKELFARAIHENSVRARNNFVVVDCTSLPENLVESVLFGHQKGAFTGADRTSEGLIQHADGGTLFLDEVGELPISVQKKFLRVLQEHRFRPVGDKQEILSNFRLIAATNRNLELMVQTEQLRLDLFYRLRTFTIELSPLHQRREDIRDLTRHYIDSICANNCVNRKEGSPEFFEALETYDWPGNIRELINTLEQVIITDPWTSVLYPQHLPEHIRIPLARKKLRQSASSPESPPFFAAAFPSLKDAREKAMKHIEQQYLHDLMELVEGDIHKACLLSGLSRARLYELLKKYNISR